MRVRSMAAVVEEMKLRGIIFIMHDLAKRIGTSKRTLYKYFSSKEA